MAQEDDVRSAVPARRRRPPPRDAFLGFWAAEGRQHFRDEEEILLPAFARHEPPTHEAVVRVLTDSHRPPPPRRRPRERLHALGADDLRELGETAWHAHVNGTRSACCSR